MQGIQELVPSLGVSYLPKMLVSREGSGTACDITLVDRHVTVILNGRKVINNQPIPGCTNGALHSDETLPGPLYLQGDHTSVSYRNIVLTPVLTSIPSVDEWPQAAGPTGNFITQATRPSNLAEQSGDNVRWRVPLPNTGQSAAIISGGRIFVTSHEPITQDTQTGAAILGLCFDAETGEELWRRTIPGTRETDLSSLFNDNTGVLAGDRWQAGHIHKRWRHNQML